MDGDLEAVRCNNAGAVDVGFLVWLTVPFMKFIVDKALELSDYGSCRAESVFGMHSN